MAGSERAYGIPWWRSTNFLRISFEGVSTDQLRGLCVRSVKDLLYTDRPSWEGYPWYACTENLRYQLGQAIATTKLANGSSLFHVLVGSVACSACALW
jgi:hypothetical protein